MYIHRGRKKVGIAHTQGTGYRSPVYRGRSIEEEASILPGKEVRRYPYRGRRSIGIGIGVGIGIGIGVGIEAGRRRKGVGVGIEEGSICLLYIEGT